MDMKLLLAISHSQLRCAPRQLFDTVFTAILALGMFSRCD